MDNAQPLARAEVVNLPAQQAQAKQASDGQAPEVSAAASQAQPLTRNGKPVKMSTRFPGRELAPSGECDLSRLKPRRLESILDALRNGLSIRQICRAFDVSPTTVALIRERHPEPVEAEKRRLQYLYSTFSRVSIERALEDVDKIPPGLLVLNACQATDKMLLLIGESTARVEHKLVLERNDVASWIDSLPSCNASPALLEPGNAEPPAINITPVVRLDATDGSNKAAPDSSTGQGAGGGLTGGRQA